jgi:two-component system, OmpR family, sensor histidine kinase KdpD
MNELLARIEDEPRQKPNGRRMNFLGYRRQQWMPYIHGLALVGAATALGAVVHLFINPTNLAMLYLLSVVIAALYLGRGPAVLVSAVGVLAFDFFFVPPGLTLRVSDTQYIITFISLFIVGLVISQLTLRTREQAQADYRRETETATLYALSRDLAVVMELEAIVRTIIKHVSHSLGCQVVIWLPETEGGSSIKPFAQNIALQDEALQDEKEALVSSWSFQHGQPAGRGTNTFPTAQAYYLPLKTAKGIVGVMGIQPPDPDGLFTAEQLRLLEAFASLAALAVERAHLAEAARNAQVMEAAEKLRAALLNSISHDLRTPLVSITGTLTSLQDEGLVTDDTTRRNLIETARGEAERLNRLVSNLLDMTRIEAGAMKVLRQPSEVQDVVGSALDQLGERLTGRKILIDIPEELPLAPMDPVLIGQVFVNLVDNALKYSPLNSPVEVRAWVADTSLVASVADRGIGIPPKDLPNIFDKFYRVGHPGNVSGTGLGLSICKGIVEAHSGQIRAQNRAGGGTIITLYLPLKSPEAEPSANG